jgi:hypothetical protein
MVQFEALSAGLGTILGYLGAEVATETTFERLLWPQRFYNDFSFTICLQMMFLMPFGGPLHRAALETLGGLQENGVYRGRKRGNYLGTRFYASRSIGYYARTLKGHEKEEKETRNGFWVLVSRRMVHGCPEPADTEQGVKHDPKRASCPVHHIKLAEHKDGKKTPEHTVVVSEDHLTYKSYAGVFASEISAIVAAFLAGVVAHTTWLAIYFVLPLLFKLLSLAVSVRRNQIEPAKDGENKGDIIFEIADENYGHTLVQGPEYLVRQFFRHYGHPERENRSREICCFVLIYLFAAYFPAGLIALVWMNKKSQLVWLSYQLFTVLSMHVARLSGLVDCGRTELRVARLFELGEGVLLKGAKGQQVYATATTNWVENVADARNAVKRVTRS